METTQSKDNKKIPTAVQDVPTATHTNREQVTDGIDPAYLTSSRFTKFYRSVLFQMILFGA
jgi:hypothetical protein